MALESGAGCAVARLHLATCGTAAAKLAPVGRVRPNAWRLRRASGAPGCPPAASSSWAPAQRPGGRFRWRSLSAEGDIGIITFDCGPRPDRRTCAYTHPVSPEVAGRHLGWRPSRRPPWPAGAGHGSSPSLRPAMSAPPVGARRSQRVAAATSRTRRPATVSADAATTASRTRASSAFQRIAWLSSERSVTDRKSARIV